LVELQLAATAVSVSVSVTLAVALICWQCKSAWQLHPHPHHPKTQTHFQTLEGFQLISTFWCNQFSHYADHTVTACYDPITDPKLSAIYCLTAVFKSFSDSFELESGWKLDRIPHSEALHSAPKAQAPKANWPKLQCYCLLR